MRCERCGMELMGGRGAYHWRSEVAAIGDDVLSSTEIDLDLEKYRRRLFEELSAMDPEEIENDVYQLWEGVLCRPCRLELGKLLARFLR